MDAPHIRRPLSTLVALAFAASATVAMSSSCGRKIEEEEDPPAHRIAPCEGWCDATHGPCGPEEGEGKAHRDECVELCANEDFIWGLVDGEDLCKDVHIREIECVAALTCEELQCFFDDDKIFVHPDDPRPARPCDAEVEVAIECRQPDE